MKEIIQPLEMKTIFQRSSIIKDKQTKKKREIGRKLDLPLPAPPPPDLLQFLRIQINKLSVLFIKNDFLACLPACVCMYVCFAGA